MKIKVTFFGILMFLSLIVTHSYLSLAALLAAFVHEMGHLLAASLCGVPIKELKLDIFGAAITPDGAFYSYKKEIAVALGGPLVNIISFIICFFFARGRGQFMELFLLASIFLGALNLLPIRDFDGGRILHCVLSYKFSPEVADKVCMALSFAVLMLLWMLSVYLILRFWASLSLFVFSFALLCKILMDKKAKIK